LIRFLPSPLFVTKTVRVIALGSAFLIGTAILPALSASPPVRGDQCSNTFVKTVTSRFGAEEWQFGSEDGILEFTNGLGVYLYRTLRSTSGWGLSEESRSISLAGARALFSPNDPVKVCLEYVPTDCPARGRLDDRRGEIYYISNFRNSKSAYAHFGRNPCGGA
jgi:hypothetical protein